jgi:hypothetical protein
MHLPSSLTLSQPVEIFFWCVPAFYIFKLCQMFLFSILSDSFGRAVSLLACEAVSQFLLCLCFLHRFFSVLCQYLAFVYVWDPLRNSLLFCFTSLFHDWFYYFSFFYRILHVVYVFDNVLPIQNAIHLLEPAALLKVFVLVRSFKKFRIFRRCLSLICVHEILMSLCVFVSNSGLLFCVGCLNNSCSGSQHCDVALRLCVASSCTSDSGTYNILALFSLSLSLSLSLTHTVCVCV